MRTCENTGRPYFLGPMGGLYIQVSLHLIFYLYRQSVSYILHRDCFLLIIGICFLLIIGICFLLIIGIVLVVCIVNPWVFIPIVPLSILFYLVQKYYLTTSRHVKRLEGTTEVNC
ncbi:hypothetical protein KUTeg_012189 [Tegillarca granosa]|uniref:Uncharacterized protein n=1 Tax=Tegillarca granosa TaxID=220873 RepID=A0ABQ9EYS9_TEGGR|nr:hypothetical protein KUTeg_012189 [Tegillarca granosa]